MVVMNCPFRGVRCPQNRGGGALWARFSGYPRHLEKKKQTGSGTEPQKQAKYSNIEVILASKMATIRGSKGHFLLHSQVFLFNISKNRGGTSKRDVHGPRWPIESACALSIQNLQRQLSSSSIIEGEWNFFVLQIWKCIRSSLSYDEARLALGSRGIFYKMGINYKIIRGQVKNVKDFRGRILRRDWEKGSHIGRRLTWKRLTWTRQHESDSHESDCYIWATMPFERLHESDSLRKRLVARGKWYNLPHHSFVLCRRPKKSRATYERMWEAIVYKIGDQNLHPKSLMSDFEQAIPTGHKSEISYVQWAIVCEQRRVEGIFQNAACLSFVPEEE